MLKNKYVNALVDFIQQHINDFQDILLKSPYNLKNVKNCEWHKNWYMFNYSLSSSDLKNDIVRACRGIVLSIDNNGIKPVSVPYTKFFNYDEEDGKDIDKMINWSKAKVSLKIDGSLLKTACVEENGEKRLYFFTNGSFNLNSPISDSNDCNEKEIKGMKTYGELLSYALKKVDDKISIFYDKEIGSFYIKGGWSDKIPIGSTLMFELVSPKIKIICEYKETKLYLHGYRHPDLIEQDPRELDFGLNFEFPEILDASNYEDLKKIIETFNGKEKEGCVVVDYTSPETPRAKVKCSSYLKSKFSYNNASNNQSLFKSVVFDEYDDLISSAPSKIPKIEEIKDKIDKFKKWFVSESKKVSEICKGKDDIENKKTWAFYWKKKVSKDLYSIYMIMPGPDNLSKLDKKLEFLAIKKNGFEYFKKYLDEIKII